MDVDNVSVDNLLQCEARINEKQTLTFYIFINVHEFMVSKKGEVMRKVRNGLLDEWLCRYHERQRGYRKPRSAHA